MGPRFLAAVAVAASLAGLAACGDGGGDEAAGDPCLTTTTTTTTTTVAGAVSSAPSTTENPCPTEPVESAAPTTAAVTPAPTAPPVTTAAVVSAAPTTPPATAPPTTAPPTTAPEADPRGRRFAYTGTIGVFPVTGEFCVAVAAPITITTPPDATVDLAEVTGDPTAPEGDVPYEVEITFSAELPTTGEMAYVISAGGVVFQGAGTYVIEWSSFGVLAGSMVLSDDAATASGPGLLVDDTNDVAGLFDISEVGTC